jgi:hypothetical protein
MKPNNKIFICSSDLFHGYKLTIDMNNCDNVEDILKIFKDSLINLLTNNNLEILVNELDNRNLHIHTHTFEDILISDRETVYYICDNCSGVKNNILFNSNSL